MRPKNSYFRSPLKVPHARPKSLSDPFDDHGVEHTQALLAKPDNQLEWGDYQCVLGPFLPAGTYRESVYFLPLAFEYIVSHKDDALDLVTSIVWFISEYAYNLEQDGLLTASRDRMVQCLECWTEHFTVVHRAKGWLLTYFDYVENVEVVREEVYDLVRFERHADLAESFYRSLTENRSDMVKAAWYLELVRAQSDGFHHPKHTAIRAMLADREAIERAAVLVGPLVAEERSPTYWNDTFRALAITV